jgi:hypothetical protein
MPKIKNKKIILTFAVFFFVSILACFTALADTTLELYPNQQMIPGASSQTCDISTYIQQIIAFGYATIGILTMFMLGVGAYQYIMSAGNTPRMASAKNTVNYAILGLVLGLLSWIILYTINPNLVKVSLGETVPCTLTTKGTTTGKTTTVTNEKYDAISLKKSTKDRVNSYCNIISEASQKYGVPENIIKAVIDQESGGIYNARSPAGAVGLMQLMPGTASGLGVTDRTDPNQNIMGATKYLSQMYNKYGNWTDALGAYNFGPGNYNKYLNGKKSLPKETQKYIPSVLGKAESYKNEGCSTN